MKGRLKTFLSDFRRPFTMHPNKKCHAAISLF